MSHLITVYGNLQGQTTVAANYNNQLPNNLNVSQKLHDEVCVLV